MSKPKLDRNGEGVAQETSQAETAQVETTDSPALEAKAPVKQVVFMSVDKELCLYYKGTDLIKLPDGRMEYVPPRKAQFKEGFYPLADIPENQFAISWLRGHPSFNISFREVADMSNMVELPSIEQMRQMPVMQLKELCMKKEVKVGETDSKESIILALIENGK